MALDKIPGVDHRLRISSSSFNASMEPQHIRYLHQAETKVKPILDSLVQNGSKLQYMATMGYWENIKYLLIHYEKEEKDLTQIDAVMQKIFSQGLWQQRLYPIYDLLCRYPYNAKKIGAEKEALTNKPWLTQFLSCYSPRTGWNLREKGRTLQEAEITRMSELNAGKIVLPRTPLSFIHDLNIEHQWIYLALTAVATKEPKEESAEEMPRITRMSQLLPLDPYAVHYAFRQLERSRTSQTIALTPKLLDQLAKDYLHYIQMTSHITQIETHEDYLQIHRYIHSRNSASFILEQAETKIALVNFANSFQSVILSMLFTSIIVAYCVEDDPWLTPGLCHMLQALKYSKDNCKACSAKLSDKPVIFNSKQPHLLSAEPAIVEQSTSFGY